MRNSDLIHSVKDEFASFHYSTIPCVRQNYQASINIYNFNKVENFRDVSFSFLCGLSVFAVNYYEKRRYHAD